MHTAACSRRGLSAPWACAGILAGLLSVILLPAAAGQNPPAPPTFRAGAATSNITPDIGGNIVGGFNPAPSQHIHDELHARCLVLDNGDKRLALVVLDLLGADEALFHEARRLTRQATGLPEECLFISCTHTHSAQSALGPGRQFGERKLDDYQRFVARRIADGVRRAINNLAPAQIGWAVASEPREVFNRRWYLKPGTMPVNPFGETSDLVKMNPGRGNPNLVRPAGPVDPEVSVLAVRSPEGRPIAVYACYSLHYVGGGRPHEVSADYFAIFADRLMLKLQADRLDPPFVAMMANGTSGDVNNIDVQNPSPKRYAPYEKMREVADRVSDAAMKAYASIQWHDHVPLAARLEPFEVGLRHPTSEQLARARAIISQAKDAKAKAALDYIYAVRTVQLADWPDVIPILLHTLRIGQVAMAGIPCEVFVETGLAYKQKSPFKPSFIVSLSNGYYGYLPTPEQHKLGGYETWLGTNRLEIAAADKILARLLEMTAQMK